MDAVILAAGRGSRLEGIAAPFHKPLLVVNGQPLIQQAVDHALAMTMLGGDVTVVAAPSNAEAIVHVLGRRPYRMVIQKYADGPGAALLEGLATNVSSDHTTLVLMADNVTSRADVVSCVEQAKKHEHGTAIGVRYLHREEAKRFTYYFNDEWHETGDVPHTSASVLVWCGPLIIPTLQARIAIGGHTDGKIGSHLSEIFGSRYPVRVVVDTIDIGVPEMLT